MKEIAPLIINWYQENKRDLPWREDKNPYHIWISEIMLQQTRIQAVKKYYERFLKDLPTIVDLANVDEEKLLKLWEGLGYYSRARNLKKSAQIIVEKYHEKMPQNYKELLKLPGIAEYTAGAIASIAFLERVPAVDGNVLRVISRVIGSKKDILLLETKQEITELLKEIIPVEADLFNEGLMEIGERICLPNAVPLCDKCPLCNHCIAKKENLTNIIPVRIKKTKRKIENKTIFILVYQDEIAILQRPATGLLANLYEFINIDGFMEEKEIKDQMQKWNLESQKVTNLGRKKHIFTHITWEMQGYRIELKNKNDLFIWIKKDELDKTYALPTAFAKWKENIERTLFDL